jgi:hypothetical protein
VNAPEYFGVMFVGDDVDEALQRFHKRGPTGRNRTPYEICGDLSVTHKVVPGTGIEPVRPFQDSGF